MKAFFRISTTLAFLLCSISGFSASIELAKHYDREFKVSPTSKLYVENKYGQISIENWDKSAISIHVEVKVENSSDERAKAMLEAIKVEFSETGNLISAITRFDEDIRKSYPRFFSSISNTELSINYKILMPKNIEVELVNKYGNIFVNELNARVAVDLNYGNFKANKLGLGDSQPLNSIEIGYGDVTITEANWIKVEMKYSNLNIDAAQAMVVLSKYSKVYLGRVNSLVLESKYDKYEIDSVTNLEGESGYTDFTIFNLGKKFNLIAKYGNVKMLNVSDSFQSIRFEGAYTGLKAGINPGVSYRIDAEAAYGNININAEKSAVSRIEDNTTVQVSGLVGTNSRTKAEVYVRIKYGNANLSK
jgi:hypothetical protein